MFSGDNNFKGRLVANTKPTLFKPLESALPEATRAARKEELEKQLDNFADTTVEFSYNVTNSSYGRGFETHRRLYQALFDQLILRFEEERDEAQTTLLLRFVDKYGDLVDEDTVFGEVDVTSLIGDQRVRSMSENEKKLAFKSKRLEVLEEFEAAARQEKTFEDRVAELRKNTGLDQFAALLNNQPQLHFSLALRFRGDLVGPDQTTIKATWETGIVNLNSLRDVSGRSCGPVAAAESRRATECLRSLPVFVQENREALRSAQRLAISVEYTDTEDYSLSLPDDGVELMLEGSHKWTFSGAYGRLLSVDEQGNSTSRVDVKASYESPVDDIMRNKRFLATFTITKKFGDLSVPFGVVFANKPEFLGDVDGKLTALIGLKFDISE